MEVHSAEIGNSSIEPGATVQVEDLGATEEQQTVQTDADLPRGDDRVLSASINDSGLSESSSVDVAKELRERALRIVRAGGAAEVITNEKALPETPPNALLLAEANSSTYIGAGS